MTLSIQLASLGITEQHLNQCRMPLEEEAVSLVSAGVDIFDREIYMTPETFSAWQKMQLAALEDSVELQVVSAFRSVDYQCDLIKRKLRAGQSIEQILRVNAIPGYSEHHTGRAIDLTTPDSPPLEEQFENTSAFAWLNDHGEKFAFALSYPRDNAAGIDYEPWHWAYQG